MNPTRLRRLSRSLPILLAVLPAVAWGADERLLRYFTAEQIAAHDAYVGPLYIRWALDQAWWFLFLVLFLVLQLNRKLKLRCEAWAGQIGARLGRSRALRSVGGALTRLWGDATWGGAVLFVVAYLAIGTLIDLPSDFYFGWLRERRHGLSVQPLPKWLWDAFKGFAFGTITMSALAFGLFGLARRRRNWWLLLGAPCAVLMLGAGLLDPYRVQLYRDYEPVPEGPARAAIAATLKKAGVEFEDVIQLKMRDVTRRVNAFIAGQGPSRRIVLWDTFLAQMTQDEVANAVAHELGHLRDRSAGRLILASLLLVPYLYVVAVALRWLGRKRRFGFDGDTDVASLPAAMLLIWLVAFLGTPASGFYERHMEKRADEYALTLLEQPEAFRSMMVKLASLNRADLHPPAWTVVLLSSHPRVLDRIEHAESFAQARGIALQEPRPQVFSVVPIAGGTPNRQEAEPARVDSPAPPR